MCLVAEGETAFIGPSEQAQKFFAESGHSCPPNFNPADHYIFTLAIRPGNEEKCREKCKVDNTFNPHSLMSLLEFHRIKFTVLRNGDKYAILLKISDIILPQLCSHGWGFTLTFLILYFEIAVDQ